jgi:drug/metabolite transporter (DMT)-like permease
VPLQDSVTFNMALLYGAAALFGTNQLCNKIAVGGHSPASVNMLRFIAASATMLPAMRRGLARDQDPELRRRGLELGVWLLLGYSAQSVGVAHTTAGHAAFTTTFTVLTVPLIAGLLGRRIPGSTWAAGAAAVLGVALLDWGGEGLAISGGDLLCIASAMIFGVHTVRMEEATKRFPDSSQELAALQIAVVALGSIVWEAPELLAVAREGGAAGLAGFAADLPWALGIYMGVATTALTLWMEARAMKVVSAPTAALIYSSEPLWGAGLSFLVLGERWGPAGGAGAALILAACLGSQIAGDGGVALPPSGEDAGADAGQPACDAPHSR